ncbi:MAG: CotH kinase family protein [Cryomorphaceae bacterium]|nr:CotH kinase family protein [Cryomorphaceae bacterium]
MKKYIFTIIVLLFAFLINTAFAQGVMINEIMASNRANISDEDNDFEDWIEIFNPGNDTISLLGYGLSKDSALPFTWVFPDTTILPGSHILVWASGKNRDSIFLHTPFTISASGDELVLTKPNGDVADFLETPGLHPDVSFGRVSDGTSSWAFYYTPTPSSVNAGQSLNHLLNPPFLSHDGGIYNAAFDLSVFHFSPGAIIVYTIDGSEPRIADTAGSSFQYKNQYALNPGDPTGSFLTSQHKTHLYSAPISISDRDQDPNVFSTRNTRQDVIYVPPSPVRKGVTLRVRAYVNGIASPEVVKTFFVWPNGNPYDLPVISLKTNEGNLFDYDDGIYTSGVDFDTWRANNPTNAQWWRPNWNNYNRRGREAEKDVHIEIYEPNGFTSVLSQHGGVRIHGNNSRTFLIKNLRLYARGSYDQSSVFQHNLFDQSVYGAEGPNTDLYKRILLRSDGTGGFVSYDVVMNRLLQPVFSGVMRVKPAIHFINGEFWGITSIRDRIDRHHYANQFNLNPDNIIQMSCQGSNCEMNEGLPGESSLFYSMRNFIVDNDMSNSAHYEQALDMLDIKSFTDHMVLQIFSGDNSYERNVWRVRVPENSAFGDGKWRFDTQDFDAALNFDRNWLAYRADITNNPNSALLGNLLENDSFKAYFINRFADLLNSVLTPIQIQKVIDKTFEEVAPYLMEDKNRSNRDNFYEPGEKANLTNFAINQPDNQRDSIEAFFNLDGTYNLMLSLSHEEAGFVKVNTIDVKEGSPGFDEFPYPWEGVYFKEVPVTLIAQARPGFVFSHWSGDVSGSNDTIVVTASGNMQIQANYTNNTSPDVLYFWMIDKNVPNNSPLDSLVSTYSHNPNTPAVIKYESSFSGYPFAAGHANWRKASLERRNAPTPVNYRPMANANKDFRPEDMRGLQIRQPFRVGNEENAIVFKISTEGKKDIKVSFAAEDDGAAEEVLIEYWDGTQWTSAGLPQSVFPLQTAYTFMEADFSGVSNASHNPEFRVRIRFDGANMRADNGNRVHINNIAVEGVNTLSNEAFGEANAEPSLLVYPNPTSHLLNIQADGIISQIEVMDLSGSVVLRRAGQMEKETFSLGNLPAGMYLVRVQWAGGERVVRVVRQ